MSDPKFPAARKSQPQAASNRQPQRRDRDSITVNLQASEERNVQERNVQDAPPMSLPGPDSSRAPWHALVPWESVAWVALVIAAAVLRFYELGVRGMSHDESLHTMYGYYLYNEGRYEHNPMMHGPFRFHMTALSYFLFGANDYTSRIVPALLGTGLVGVIYLFRRWIGRTGALTAAVLVTFSPSLLFHSRYIRDDIFVATFTTLWALCAFRYFETRRFGWLMGMVVAMGFSFVTMENSFITGAIFGGGFILLALWDAINWRTLVTIAPLVPLGVFSYYYHAIDRDDIAVPLLAAGLAVTVALGVFFLITDKGGWGRLRKSVHLDAAVLMLTLVLPFLGSFLHVLLGGQASVFTDSSYTTGALVQRMMLLVGVCALLATGLAALWFQFVRRPDAVGNAESSPQPQAGASEAAEDAGNEEGALSRGHIGFRLWAQLMAAFWVIQVLFFTTFFTNTTRGLASGIVGSLGYWLAQQNVERGNQPWYYYLMIGSLYEFVPMILSLVAGVVLVRGLIRRSDQFPVAASDLPPLPSVLDTAPFPAAGAAPFPAAGAAPFPAAGAAQSSAPILQPQALAGAAGAQSAGVTDPGLQPQALSMGARRSAETRNHFAAFMAIWALGMWIGYTVAGEKMPWLLTHMALPMSILGGWWLGRLLHGVIALGRSPQQTGMFWIIPLVPVLLLLAVIFVRALPPGGENAARTIDAAAGWMRVIMSGAALAGGLALLVVLAWRDWRRAGALVAIGALALLFVFNVRASLMLAFVNHDSATEYLVYAHASPDVKEAMAEIESISERTVGARNIVVAYDDESSWPFSWYFRDYPNARFYGSTPDSTAMSAPIILVAPENREKVIPYVQRDYVQRTHIRIWWPDMDYFNMTRARLWDAISNPQQRERLWQIILFRRHRDTNDFSRFRDIAQWPARHEFDMWVRKDLAAQIWDLNVTPINAMGAADPFADVQELETSASTILAGSYSGAALKTPRAVTSSPDGRIVIADTGNHRIVILNADGSEYKVFGSLCDLSKAATSGCADPDGSGPLVAGDGQFNEPWGVAVDAQGRIFVSDTWNGRIQVFSPEGQFLRKWGYFNSTGGELGDALALFGPRGLAIDLNGNMLVADTGNKRVIRFTPDGDFVDQIGGGGVIAGRFDEPTSVDVDPSDGSILVADTWNRRIQRFDPALAFMAEFPVPGWESKEIFDKPDIAVAADGRVYATDPQYYRVFVFDREGKLEASFGRFGTEANRFGKPIGIAADLTAGTILVADADNARVMAFPASQLQASPAAEQGE